MTRSENMEHVEVLRDALRKAFRYGETHWQQADSEYSRDHRKAGETMDKFRAWADETAAAIAALSAPQPPAEAQGGWDLKEVVCLACGDHIMPMGQVCHACSYPVSAPPSAPVGVDADLFSPLNACCFRDQCRANAQSLAQQPAAVDEALDRLRRENVPCLWHADLVGGRISEERMRVILTAALAAQQGGVE